MKPADMTKYLGVHRNTTTAYLNGQTRPDTRTLRLWALRTGVRYEWLASGLVSPKQNGVLDSEHALASEQCAIGDLNSEPAD